MPNKPLRLASFLLLATVVACGRGAAPAESTGGDITSQLDPEEWGNLPVYEAPPLPTQTSTFFSGSGACASCHTDLVDEAGNDVSIGKDWRGAIMANASRDPYWQATVRSEVLDHPALKDVIEDKCATCHTSMARFTAIESGAEYGLLLDDGFLDEQHRLHDLAIDGVSCTLCHQIEEEGLGEPDSFSGEFSVDTERSPEERLAYGPYAPVPEVAAEMRNESGFIPVEAEQTGSAELCASCHTLYTPYVDEDGEVAGTFPEQVPYLEWQHSDYADSRVCQDCHMPAADGRVKTATTPGSAARAPFAQHRFIGGNTYVLKMLWALGDELNVTASSDQFARKVAQTLDQLENRTAGVALQNVTLSDGALRFDVSVESFTGHKLPTGFPSRRAWLHVTVEDGQGQVLFESGAFQRNGAIVGNDNDADPALYEPHYEEITSPDQVQIYEPILAEVSGGVTTALLRASGYRKDNRLLPLGFDKSSAGGDFAVYGEAVSDANFAGGGDSVRYSIDLQNAPQDVTVTARLLYQSIGFRWAENFRGQEADEIVRFVEAYDALPNEPVVLAQDSVSP